MGDERISSMRAMAHPVRVRIASLLTGAEMSAAEVARELGLTHANASYHLRTLAEAGKIVEAGEVTIRGGVAKRYRYPHELRGRESDGGRSTTAERLAYLSALHAEVERRANHVDVDAPGYGFDLDGWVSPEVAERAWALIREASELLHDANRPPRSAGTVHVSATATTFQMVAGG